MTPGDACSSFRGDAPSVDDCHRNEEEKALLVALPWPEHLERLSALQSALCSESLRQVAQGDAAVAERCFQDASLGADATAKSPKKRRAPAGGERPRKQRRAVRKAHEGSS